MPFDILRELDSLGCQFLGAVLTEDGLAGLVGLQDGLQGVEFGNCHQFDP